MKTLPLPGPPLAASIQSLVAQGAGARVMTVPLPPFTLVGATTRAGLLSTPLRDRFGIHHRLEPYGPTELAAIVHRSAHILGCAVDPGGAEAIAIRSMVNFVMGWDHRAVDGAYAARFLSALAARLQDPD